MQSFDRDTATEAIAPFVAAAHSRVKGDVAGEREAERELRRLGYRVEAVEPEPAERPGVAR